MNRSRVALLLALAVVGAIVLGAAGLVVYRGMDDDDDYTAPEPTGEKVADGLDQFYEQKLSWRECGRAQCTKVEAPVDYEDPGGETFELSVRLYPADGKRQGSLLVNPGGPGGSAVDFAGSLANQLGEDVVEAYDVVGVDPRGVGDSTPLECLDDAAMDEFVQTDPSPDDAAEIKALRDSVTTMAEACAKNSGALASHVSTEEAARDMDIVRALLGDEKLNWFGASYGTQLGATYATLFPERVGRMVLDGAVDPSLDGFDSALGQTTGFQRAFDAYAADCQKKSACPLGDTKEDARRIVSDLFEQLDQKPLQVGSRELTEGNAVYGIALPLYSRETWDLLTDGLKAAIDDGNGAVLLAYSDAYFTREPNGRYKDNIGQVILAVNCLDADNEPDQQQVQARLGEFTDVSPVFGDFLGWGVLGCTDWPLKSATPQAAVSGQGADPIVVIGTTRDPATPYEWAKSLADQLESGVLVSRDGDGHTAYNSGNDCIDDIVDTYFVKGTVPKDSTFCDAE